MLDRHLTLNALVRKAGPLYRLRLESTMGHHLTNFKLALDDNKLHNLLELADRIRRLNHQRDCHVKEDARRLGEGLFDALFPPKSKAIKIFDECRSSVVQHLQHREYAQSHLRLALRVEPDDLAVLPWELMCRPNNSGPDYLFAGPHISLVRDCGIAGYRIPETGSDRPLSVLVLMPTATWARDLPVPEEDPKTRVVTYQRGSAEMGVIDRWLFYDALLMIRDDIGGDAVDFNVLRGVTQEDLFREVQHPYDVLYYIGHSYYDGEKKQAFLLLDDGEFATWAKALPIHALKAKLETSPIRLAVLSSCNSAQSSQFQYLSGAVQALAELDNLAGVIGMQFEVPAFCAAAFDKGFFKALVLGRPLSECVARGRDEMCLAERRTDFDPFEFPDWANPVLFGRSDLLESEFCLVDCGQPYELGLTSRDVERLKDRWGLSPEERSILETECPPAIVQVRPFCIAMLPVTNAEFHEFVETGHQLQGRTPLHWRRGDRGFVVEKGKLTHPVVGLDQRDVVSYCRWRGVRLPSAEEWEVAARGPRRHLLAGGDGPDEMQYYYSLSAGPVSVHWSTGRSDYGVRDMMGNAWEWTSTSRDGKFVAMGGCWESEWIDLLPSRRHEFDPREQHTTVGFRIAKDT